MVATGTARGRLSPATAMVVTDVEATVATAMVATGTARGRLSPATAMAGTGTAAMVAMAMVAMGTARGPLLPATDMVGTATARGLLRPSPATAMVTGTAMAATGTATARGLLRPSPATTDEDVLVHAHVTGSATARRLLSPSLALNTSTSPTPKQRFCDQLRIFNYVSRCQEVEFIREL